MDWDALIHRAKALHRARVGKEPAPEPGALVADAAQVLRLPGGAQFVMTN